MTDQEALDVFTSTRALLSGHFELRSGLHSDQYFQCAHVLCRPLEAGRLCDALVAKVRAAAPEHLKVDAVLSPAMGGIIVGHEIARALGCPAIFAEKKDGRLAMHRFDIVAGQSYIVAEDVITRGGRVQETVELVEKVGGHVRAILVLVDRSGGKAQFKYPTYALLKMEPVTWEPKDCPLCAKGQAVAHPGSK